MCYKHNTYAFIGIIYFVFSSQSFTVNVRYITGEYCTLSRCIFSQCFLFINKNESRLKVELYVDIDVRFV